MKHPPYFQAALLTSPGRGAVATIAVAGDRCSECVGQFFHPAAGKPLAGFPIGRIVFGHWRGAAGDVGEEIVVCRTAEDTVEIHCHGGRAAVDAVLRSLQSAGCEIASWQDWIAKSTPDPIAAEAHVALAAAPTAKTARILFDQYHGALREGIERIFSHCAAARVERAVAELRELHGRSRIGLHLCQPWRVVLAGAPNVGKSSLLNAIVGFARSIVFDQPGTTRDVLTAASAIDGWPVELADTAGLRAVGDDIEQQGVVRARSTADAADLLLLVFDLTSPWRDEDQALLDAYPDALVIHNKCDLAESADDRPAGLRVSALRGTGVEPLVSAIAQHLVPDPPPPGAAVPFTLRQAEAVAEGFSLAQEANLSQAAMCLRKLTANL